MSQTRHRPFIERSGAGEAVLFIHGTVISGRGTWRAQRPLSARWQVQVLERRGYPPNPAVDREDFGEDAEDVKALLLAAPAHLVAHSYGAVGALLAAADAPGRVRSLTVVEPPVFGPAIGNPEVDAFVRRMDVLSVRGRWMPANLSACLPVSWEWARFLRSCRRRCSGTRRFFGASACPGARRFRSWQWRRLRGPNS